MYVAQNAKKPNEFVAAISGANPISAHGWIVEGAKLNPTLPWPYNTDSAMRTGDIFSGTNPGMTLLTDQLQDKGKKLS